MRSVRKNKAKNRINYTKILIKEFTCSRSISEKLFSSL